MSLSALEKWQKQIDQIWQEPFAIDVIRMLELRIARIKELKAAGVRPSRKNGKIVVPR